MNRAQTSPGRAVSSTPKRAASLHMRVPGRFAFGWRAKRLWASIPSIGPRRMKFRASAHCYCARCGRYVNVSVCVGGTDVAQKVIAQTGFRPIGDMLFYSRPLRPFRQFLTHQRRNIKLPARWLRNLIWAHRAGRQTPEGWTAVPVDPDEIPAGSAARLKRSSTRLRAFARTISLLLTCPVAPFHAVPRTATRRSARILPAERNARSNTCC